MKRIFKLYDEIAVGTAPPCHACRNASPKLSKPWSPWVIGKDFTADDRKVLFVGKTARGDLECGDPDAQFRARRAADKQARRQGRTPSGPPWMVIGRSVFYKLTDLDAWIDSHAVPYGQVRFREQGPHYTGLRAPSGGQVAGKRGTCDRRGTAHRPGGRNGLQLGVQQVRHVSARGKTWIEEMHCLKACL